MLKLFDRIFQFVFYLARPFLPWREPKILRNYEDLSTELRHQGKKRVLICIDHNLLQLGIHQALIANLSEHAIDYSFFTDISPSPTIAQVENALIKYEKCNADAIIGFGGGSSLDVAKALGARVARPQKPLTKMGGLFKVRKKLPFLAAVPTTAGTGSEATLAAVIVDEKTKRKYAINDFTLIPDFALLVPDLTLPLPPFLTATTGMDTLTHAIEAYTNNGGTRFTNGKAINAVRLVFSYLPTAYSNPLDYEARTKLQLAAYDAGVAFTRNYVGYVHALSHPLSAFYAIPHGYANALILPFMLEKYGKERIFDEFKNSLYIDGEHTGKLTHRYIDEERFGSLVDYTGLKGYYNQLSGINLAPADFTLSQTANYILYLAGLQTDGGRMEIGGQHEWRLSSTL